MTESLTPPAERPADQSARAMAVFWEFLRLGLTSFGGPVAHIGYFRAAFVQRLRWVQEADFADLVALCQFLPGPASSQLGMAIGFERAGLPGALAAFLGFTLPSALLMTALALSLTTAGGRIDAGVLAGLAIVAVAVVAEAVRGMAVSLARGRRHAAIALASAAAALAVPGAATQIAILAGGGLLGLLFGVRSHGTVPSTPDRHLSHALGASLLASFAVVLFGLPALAAWLGAPTLQLLASFYRAGSLVFGGGHVVLPLLEQATVAPGIVSQGDFIAGYGAAQAMPGPLFSIAAFLGGVAARPDAIGGAALTTLALFAPGFLLVIGALPFWRSLRAVQPVRRALAGVNAAVVGLLGAALYDPVFATAIHGRRDLAAALVCYGLITAGRVPPWAVVLLAALAGWWLG